MEPWHPSESEENLVEAIEEGRIVKVPKEHALREGLPILRKQQPSSIVKPNEKSLLSFEKFRKPLNYKSSQVFQELADNFHWLITKKRRYLGLTRKQLALSINESEETIKQIENGILPKDDFKTINKIQSRLDLNFRKDKKDFEKSPRSLLKKDKIEEKKNKEESDIFGDDIELIED
jgi:ribosome-binding protein aMBF1 (putative translation factor)